MGTQLTLNVDGTFQINGPNGQLTGTYQHANDQIMVRDQFGNTYQYTVQALTSTTLNMMENVSAVSLQYVRQQGQDTQLLAQSNGYALRLSDVQLGQALIQFITEQSINTQEFEILKNSAIREFKADPKGFSEGMDGLKKVLNMAKQSQDVSIIAQLRQSLFSELYKANKDQPLHEQSEIVRIMLNYLTVESYDPKTGMVLSSRDLDASVNYLAKTLELQSGQALSSAGRQQIQQTLKTQFTQLPKEEQAFYANGSVYWAMVEANLQQFSQQQYTQFQQQYAGNEPQYQSIPSWGDQQQGQQMSQETYEFLSQMSLQNHVSMMNGIENMGGTGDYWQIRPSYLGDW